MLTGALEGVKVLDLSEDIAGSFCARLLADYGADVLKLEPPAGSALRQMGPFFHDDPHPDKSLFFLVLNLNKKSATLNLETVTGQAILKRLVPHVDVIVESYRPGYLASLGLGHQELASLNPALTMTSISPFGQDRALQPVPGRRNRQLRHGHDNEHQRSAGTGTAEARRLPGPVRGRLVCRRRHVHGPVWKRVYRPGRAHRRFHYRVHRLDNDGHPDHVSLHGRHPSEAAGQRQHVRPPHALRGRVDHRADGRGRFMGRPGRVLPVPRNAGGTFCRPSPASGERRGTGQHCHRVHQGPEQVGPFPQGGGSTACFSAWCKPRRN